MFAPVLGGLSTHGLRKATGKEKPPQYDLKWAQYSVARNAERIGIDPASIVGYWPMWEGAGKNVWDVSLYGNKAINEGGDWLDKRQGIQCNNAGELINVGDTYNFTTNDQFTILSQIRTTTGGLDWSSIFCRRNEGDYQYQLRVNDNNYLSFLASTGSNESSFNFTTDEEAFVGFVWYGNGSDHLFCKNKEFEALSASESISSLNVNCYIANQGSGQQSLGKIRYCLVFNTTLTRDKIDFFRQFPHYLLQPVPIVRWFDMGAAGLTFDSIIQGQTVVSPTLAQLQSLGISSVAQSQTVGSLSISQIHAITTNAIKQGQTIDSLSLQQMISLAINTINQGQNVDQVTISQLQQLAVDSVKQSQSMDSLTVDQLISLTINNISQDQLVDSPALTLPGELTINSIVQGQNVVSPTLQQAQGLLNVASVSQGQSVSALSLEQVHSLITDSINQGQSIDTTNLDQIISLAIDSVSQGQTLSEPSFYAVTVLDIDSIQQGQTVEATSASQVSQLIIDKISQGQVIENINFSIAKGRLQITIKGKKPGVDFDGKTPTTRFQ